jgi:hypothetical protein
VGTPCGPYNRGLTRKREQQDICKRISGSGVPHGFCWWEWGSLAEAAGAVGGILSAALVVK